MNLKDDVRKYAFKVENLEYDIKYLKFDLKTEKKISDNLRRWFLPEEDKVLS